ncbi:MAG: hypothetical protein JWO31_4219, partial [Phycisphaerales bacterium]|nr:hypothetical protein [Phycisphaerales bacterium]
DAAGRREIDTPAGRVTAAAVSAATGSAAPTAGAVVVSIRPEQMQVVKPTAAGAPAVPARNRFTGRVLETTFLGEASEHVLDVAGQRVRVIAAPPLFDVPPELVVEFDPEDVVVLKD